MSSDAARQARACLARLEQMLQQDPSRARQMLQQDSSRARQMLQQDPSTELIIRQMLQQDPSCESIIREESQQQAKLQTTKMPEMIDGVKTTGSGSDTWQYKILNQNFDKIIEKLADFKLARKVADKLAAREVIGKSVRDEADVTGPGVTESLRVRPIITALQSKVETDARVYHQFLEILQSDDIAVDAEAALYYLPKSEADALSVLKECLPQPQKAVHILTGTIITPAAPHDLVEEEWYHGHISYIEAEKRLKASPDGYFLVRESASSPGNYILNMKHNGEITHFLVEFRKDPHTFEVEGSRRSFGQLQDLIQHYTQHPITAKQEKLLGACPNPNSRGPFVNLSDRLRLWF